MRQVSLNLQTSAEQRSLSSKLVMHHHFQCRESSRYLSHISLKIVVNVSYNDDTSKQPSEALQAPFHKDRDFEARCELSLGLGFR
jgi:hypothetical protein